MTIIFCKATIVYACVSVTLRLDAQHACASCLKLIILLCGLQAGEWQTVRAWNVQRRVSDFVYLQRILRRRTTLHVTVTRRADLGEQTSLLTSFFEVRLSLIQCLQIESVAPSLGSSLAI